MHQQIICRMIMDNNTADDYDLLFNRPVDCTVKYHRPSIHPPVEDITVNGVDGVTGELIATGADGSDRFILYTDLSMEDLARVHEKVINKQYTLQFLELC